MNNLALIGAGNMGEALISGIIKENILDGKQITVADPADNRLNHFKEAYQVRTTQDNTAAVKEADIIILAVKPNMIIEVSQAIKEVIAKDSLVVSIAAGVKLDDLAENFYLGQALVRVMPNTPALVGQGMSVLSPNDYVKEENLEQLSKLFKALGSVLVLDEGKMDAVTGLSGSGPAFVYLFIESLADAGVYEGLARDEAYQLAAQTVKGAAEMVLETDEHPGLLKDKVTSPSGTTITGVRALEQGNFRSTVMDAVIAASQKSKEMGK